jgi:DNA-binding transcriptional LysR family regulator
VSVATDFGVHHLSPIIGPFLEEFPGVTLSIALNNRFVNMPSEGFDIALRIGEVDDNTLKTHKLAETTKRMVASPAYFRKFGRPERIDDLKEHRLLHYSSRAGKAVWRLTAPSGEKRQVRRSGGLSVNDGQVLLNAAISGLGIAYLPSFLYAKSMVEGLVEDAIPDLPVEVESIYAVHLQGRLTQPKVHAFIDFVVQRFAGKGPMDW